MMRLEPEKLNLPNLPCKDRKSCLECEVLCPHKKPIMLAKDQEQLQQLIAEGETRIALGILCRLIIGGLEQ